MDPNVFETANAGFAQAIYEEFLRDPTAVDPEWRRLFESGVVGERGSGADGQRGSPLLTGSWCSLAMTHSSELPHGPPAPPPRWVTTPARS